MTKIAMIGAGSTIFMKNLIGDALQRESLSNAQIHLMDIDAKRLSESELVARKMISTLGVGKTMELQVMPVINDEIGEDDVSSHPYACVKIEDAADLWRGLIARV